MSDKILQLKIDRTIKEYDFLKSELDYIMGVSDGADIEFMDIINKYLEQKPALRDIYENKEREIFENNLKHIKEAENNRPETEDVDESEDVEESESTPKSKKSKSLYRQIVKVTHPDKVDDIELNAIYLRATEAYDLDDSVSLYSICSELNIEYEIHEDDLIFFNDNIDRVKGDIDLLKGTFAYKWSEIDDDDHISRDNLILDFIKLKIA